MKLYVLSLFEGRKAVTADDILRRVQNAGFPDVRVTKAESGAFLIAGNADADMVPCRIIYDTPDHRMHLFCRMRICFGTPIPAAEMKVEDPRRSVPKLRALRSRLKEELERLYEQNKFQ